MRGILALETWAIIGQENTYKSIVGHSNENVKS
jgi:hypothetical protein